MSPLLLAQLLNTLGTVGIPLILKLKSDFDAGRTQTTVTDADLTELVRLSNLTAASILAAQGIKLPTQ